MTSIANLAWDRRDWSLSTIQTRWPDGRPFEMRCVFALRCALCLRFSWGCCKHWFCGCCESCRVRESKEEPHVE